MKITSRVKPPATVASPSVSPRLHTETLSVTSMSTYHDTLPAMFTASPHRRMSKIRRNLSTRLRQIAKINAITTAPMVGPVKLSANPRLISGLHRHLGKKTEQFGHPNTVNCPFATSAQSHGPSRSLSITLPALLQLPMTSYILALRRLLSGEQ